MKDGVKAIHFLPPVIALAIAGGMLGAQRQKISRLESESAILKQRIEAQKSRLNPEISNPGTMRPSRPGAIGKDIDWREIAGYYSKVKNGRGSYDMRKMMSVQQRLRKMSKEELLAALDKIQTLELDDDERIKLESMIIGPLIEKDPELVLTRFEDHINDQQNGMSWQLASAIGEWAKNDQAAAIAWFDKKIADGIFTSKSLDGKNQVRINFETNLVSTLLANNPTAAEARIAALPADQRMGALNSYSFQRMTESEQVHSRKYCPRSVDRKGTRASFWTAGINPRHIGKFR